MCETLVIACKSADHHEVKKVLETYVAGYKMAVGSHAQGLAGTRDKAKGNITRLDQRPSRS
jgi:hypothetical protein